MENTLNAGVEINEYKPIKLVEFISNNISYLNQKHILKLGIILHKSGHKAKSNII